MVPQSIAFLNPLMKIGPQIRKGEKGTKSQKKLKDIFKRYELKEEIEDLYPFELSGGMNRRILISTAVMEHPKLVIADEPTPGLDLKVAKRAMAHFRELADIHAACLKYGTEEDGYINYVKGANIAGFMKVANSMVEQGLV